ncbi:putative lyase [Helianthus annuus]|uniref:Lyase n=2 Tax=Helianthus annuus TaxID=4232 RepID=A0A251RT07_HELAN|nr:alpha-copaene synthase-like isoform X1 [Helianthus annuus]KAF5756971.1 putative lyase [Helianthus annuus]KAJ0430413.1 putative lyase [Helianthus annuus]KAJ0448829.1 putative lyase [Helianthus annuus]KAJ0633708.1 putative lyase [Helianthus annuus]KAJ0637528.1 putative lyase [Helianthus annuus]
MATTKANTIEPERPLANFPPSIWGDRFLSFSLDNSQLEAYGEAMEQPKEQLRKLILNPAVDLNDKLSVIYFVHRLGLTYLFLKDIDGQLDKLFNQINMQTYDKADLYTTSIHFQVFRIFGYRFSCDVFNKFKDFRSGEFKEDITTDVRGMLSFFESAQLRIRGESILDEAIAFTKSKLKSIEKTLQGTLASQVKHVLERPFHRGHPMFEARQYLSHYEEEITRYDPLLTLAKLHFNYLQLLQKEELRIVSKWWKDMQSQVKTSYVRDRAGECYVWILAIYLEPYYSQARIITTKVILLLVVLDDTYDAYATIEEMRVLTQAINRWDITAMSQLPEYIKPYYKFVLNQYAEWNKQVPQQGTTNLIEASKKAFQEMATAYLREAEWRHSEVPSFEEYMKIGLITSGYGLLYKSALSGMGKIVTEEVIAWFESHPKIVTTSQTIGRLHGDLMTIAFERERAPSATGVDAYMKTFGVSENVAIEAIINIIEDGWKDINEGCLKPTEVPMEILAPLVNLTRMIDVIYKYTDGFTFSECTFKEYITLLFCVSVPM